MSSNKAQASDVDYDELVRAAIEDCQREESTSKCNPGPTDAADAAYRDAFPKLPSVQRTTQREATEHQRSSTTPILTCHPACQCALTMSGVRGAM